VSAELKKKNLKRPICPKCGTALGLHLGLEKCIKCGEASPAPQPEGTLGPEPPEERKL